MEFPLQIKNLTLQYGSRIIQRDLSFDVKCGEIFVVMGGSGCGKSTLLRHLIGLLRPKVGEIFVLGKEIWEIAPEERLKQMRQIGIVYQKGGLWSTMTLFENIALLLRMYSPCSEPEIQQLCELKLSLVGLSGYGNFYPSEISGGMQRRAALARAIALEPKLLFLDEPSSGLDPVSAHRLDELILQLRDMLGATIVVITHDLDSIFTIADRAVYLDHVKKTITACGTLSELKNRTDHADLHDFLTRGKNMNVGEKENE